MVSQEPWTREFGTPTVLQMQRLEKRAPEVLRRKIVLVDVLNSTPESIIEKLTGCFASGSEGLPELGLGTAEEDIVLLAWMKCMTFFTNAKKLQCQGNRFYYIALMLSQLAALVAVVQGEAFVTSLDIYLQETHIFKGLPFTTYQLLNAVLLVVPLLSGMLTALMSKRRYLQKWASLYSSAWQLVSEIYKFRCKVGEYDENYGGGGAKSDEEEEEQDEGDEDKGSSVGSSTWVRDTFVHRVNDIYHFAIESLGEDCIKGEKQQRDISKFDEKEALKHDIGSFVRSDLLPSCCSATCDGNPASPNVETTPKAPLALNPELFPVPLQATSIMCTTTSGCEIDPTKGTAWVEPDDFVSPMSVETYMEYRLKSLIRRSQQQTPHLARLLKRFELLGIIFTSTGTLLVILNMNLWVAFTVSLAAAFSNVMQHQMLQPRVASHNSALKDLQALKTFLDSLSIVQRRTRRVKTQCVMVTEMAVLNTISVWTGLTMGAGSQRGGADDEEKKEKKGK